MRRLEQVNDLIRGELGKIIIRDLDFPAPAMVTLTRADTSSDLHYVDVFISVLPAAEEKEVLAILEKNVAGVQRTLNRKLRMRPVPRVKFKIDVDQKRAERIEKLLAKERLKNGG